MPKKPTNPQPLLPGNCKDCRCYMPQDLAQGICSRFPPQAFLVPMMAAGLDTKPGQVQLNIRSDFPPVSANAGCWEFVPAKQSIN